MPPEKGGGGRGDRLAAALWTRDMGRISSLMEAVQDSGPPGPDFVAALT